MDDINMKKINVLLVEDTAVQRELISYLLESDPNIDVIARVNDGDEAIRILERIEPDVILMDVNMPNKNGFEASAEIMENYNIPIVLMSATWDMTDIKKVVNNMELGVVTVINKPPGIGHPDFKTEAKKIIDTVKDVSEIKVVRRKSGNKTTKRMGKIDYDIGVSKMPKIIVIGSSAGGPPALQSIICGLPSDFPVPILVVQHMTTGFNKVFTNWLDTLSLVNVVIASHDQKPLPNYVYIAPDGHDMILDSLGNIRLYSTVLQPTVSSLFSSALKAYGKDCVSIMLSGMGRDGAAQMKELRDAGGVTIAQDKESSVVFGMPGEAVKIGGALYQLPPQKILEYLKNISNNGLKDLL